MFTRILRRVTIIALWISLIYHCLDPTLADSIQKIISVTLYNSYSGTIARSSSNNTVSSGWLTWFSWTGIVMDISATTWSSYTLSGSLIPLYGSWIGWYTHTHMIDLPSIDDILLFQAHFERDLEPYDSNILRLAIDRTSPSLPQLLWPIDNTSLDSNGTIDLQRLASVDTGVGLSGYWLHISLHPSFIADTVIRVSSNHIQFSANALPLWTLYRYVQAVDYLWNSTSSSPGYFHYGAATTVSPPDNSGWGWGSSLLVDACPSGDHSPSYYDHRCDGSPLTSITWVLISLSSGLVISGDSITDIIISPWDPPPRLYIDSYIIVDSTSMSLDLPKILKQTLVEWYRIAQEESYVDMQLPVYREGNKFIKINYKPYVYNQLIQKHYDSWNEVFPVGYMTVYATWMVVLLFAIELDIKKIMKLSKN